MTAHGSLRLLPLLSLVAAAIALPALAYETRLQDGTRVQIDPRTNRATTFDNRGEGTVLWDGVHRLEDGSIITIRSGVVVPNVGMVESQRQPPRQTEVLPGEVDADHACAELVRKVCGSANQCRASEPCSAASQLQEMDAAERADVRHRGPELDTPRKCQEALRDSGYFFACSAAAQR
jgi:hypothetical protein